MKMGIFTKEPPNDNDKKVIDAIRKVLENLGCAVEQHHISELEETLNVPEKE